MRSSCLPALLAVSAVLAACGMEHTEVSPASSLAGMQVPVSHARTFRIAQRDGYRIVDVKASIISWGGSAQGPEQHRRIVLLPTGTDAPRLSGDLAGARIIRTPVQRIATNHAPIEAMLTALGAQDRLVAVGGVKSYNDEIRRRAFAGEIAQIGYGWHSPPNLDALIASRPDVLLMSMGDLTHVRQLERIESMGIPVLPLFFDGETDYMGRVEYIRVVGMLIGQEAAAERYVRDVADRVEALKAQAAMQPRKRAVYAWYFGGDVWMATVRNADAKLLRDANAENPLQEPDDNSRDNTKRMGTEVLLTHAREVDCWVMRDTHSVPFRDVKTLQQFKAYRNGCVFAADGMMKPDVDAFDLYETAVIRPDLVLGDLVRMLHPSLRDEPFRYVQPDTKVPR